jgi:hypothetical protein
MKLTTKYIKQLIKEQLEEGRYFGVEYHARELAELTGRNFEAAVSAIKVALADLADEDDD